MKKSIKQWLCLGMCWISLAHAYEIKTLSQTPRIYYIEDFLQEKECEYLIEKSTSALKRSTVLDASQDGAIDSRRTSQGMFFPQNSPDPILRKIEKNIAEITKLPIENGEGLQILKYGIGGEYQPHYDYFTASHPGGAETLRRGGQRVATMILYLNTTESGGETIFPLAKVSVRPKKGTAVLFYNVTVDGKDDPQSLHGGAPVIQGEKWIGVKWIRENTFR